MGITIMPPQSLENTKCEFPKPNGKGICGQPATQVVTFHGLRWSYNAKACDACSKALEKEARTNALKDR